jgi:hypothetical protein
LPHIKIIFQLVKFNKHAFCKSPVVLGHETLPGGEVRKQKSEEADCERVGDFKRHIQSLLCPNPSTNSHGVEVGHICQA